MDKIPVGETVAHAYAFAIREFPKVLGIVWAPLVVSIALGLMMTPGFFGNHIDPNDQEAMQRFSLQIFPIALLVLLPIRAMIANGVTEQALGMRSGATFVYFSLGPPIWRFIGSWVLVIVALIVLLIGGGITIGVLFTVGALVLGSVAQGHSGDMLAATIAVVTVLALYAAMIYLVVRMTFFISPVVVAEKKIDLARVWQLSQGNFWRIFAIGLALFVPILIVACAVAFATYGKNIMHLMDLFNTVFHNGKPEDIQQQMQAWSNTVRAQSLAVWPYTAAFELVFGTFTYGLLYSAAAFAYRAVMPATGVVMRD